MAEQSQKTHMAATHPAFNLSVLVGVVLRNLSSRPLISSFRIVMAAYIFMLILLPSGSIFGINVKVLCFLLLLPMAAQVSFARKQMTVERVVMLLSVPAILLLWAFLSQLYEFDATQAFAQYKDVMVTICTCWFASVLCDSDRDDTLFLLRWVIYAEVVTSSLKIALLIYAFTRGIPVSVLIETIHSVFAVQLMPFDFEMALGRIQFISDNVIPICIFAILCYRNVLSLRAGRTLLMLLVLVVSDLFSFSRYLWAFTVMALVLGLILGKKDRFQAILLAILTSITAVRPALSNRSRRSDGFRPPSSTVPMPIAFSRWRRCRSSLQMRRGSDTVSAAILIALSAALRRRIRMRLNCSRSSVRWD